MHQLRMSLKIRRKVCVIAVKETLLFNNVLDTFQILQSLLTANILIRWHLRIERNEVYLADFVNRVALSWRLCDKLLLCDNHQKAIQFDCQNTQDSVGLMCA